jgi:hypothetical protein
MAGVVQASRLTLLADELQGVAMVCGMAASFHGCLVVGCRQGQHLTRPPVQLGFSNADLAAIGSGNTIRLLPRLKA